MNPVQGEIFAPSSVTISVSSYGLVPVDIFVHMGTSGYEVLSGEGIHIRRLRLCGKAERKVKID